MTTGPDVPPLPLYAVFRAADYIAQNDKLILTDKTPYPSVEMGSHHCLPLFTTERFAAVFMNTADMRGVIVRCDATRLITMLETIRATAVVIDTDGALDGQPTMYELASLLDWLRGELTNN